MNYSLFVFLSENCATWMLNNSSSILCFPVIKLNTYHHLNLICTSPCQFISEDKAKFTLTIHCSLTLCLDSNFGEKRKERKGKGGEGKEGKRNGRKVLVCLGGRGREGGREMRVA